MEDKFTQELDLLRAFWNRKGIQLNVGISDSVITNFETEFNFKFDNDFQIYLTEINGFADDNSDEAWFCFWNLDRIKMENTDNTHPENLVWFSDHSINLCSFGFHKIDRQIYTHFDRSNEIYFIVKNFTEFIHLYLENPYQLIL